MSPQRSNSKSINTADKEWSDFSMVGHLSPADSTPREIKVNNSLSAQDLKSLKKSDPFLYYSIPGVRDATVRMELVDIHQIAQNGLKEHCQSCPASMQTASEPVTNVKRCTRISFECHTDLLLDLDELSEGFADMGMASEDVPPVDDPSNPILLNLLGRS